MHYVIIGNSAAAVGAVESIRRYDRDNPITVISDEPYHTYSRPLISYYLAGTREEKSMYYRPKDFYQRHGVETMLGKKVTALDTETRQVVLQDGEKIKYDRLLIATGGKPFVPPMKGDAVEEVTTFIKLDDAKALKRKAAPGKMAVVIGAGLIGLKAAEGLVKRGCKVTVIDLAPRVLSSILDDEGANLVRQRLEQKGIRFYLGTTVQSVDHAGSMKKVTLAEGTELEADMVVSAVGVVPNTEPVQHSGIKVNRGIITDNHLRTNVDGVYAAGDVAENYDLLHQDHRVIPILPNAYEQGEAAGANMAGADTVYPGGFAKNAIGFFGYSMVTAGVLKSDDTEEYVNSTADSYVKLVVRDNRLVGFIRINAVNRSGILTGILMDRTVVGGIIDELLTDEPRLMALPPDRRRSRIEGGAVQWR